MCHTVTSSCCCLEHGCHSQRLFPLFPTGLLLLLLLHPCGCCVPLVPPVLPLPRGRESAMGLVERLIPAPSLDDRREALHRAGGVWGFCCLCAEEDQPAVCILAGETGTDHHTTATEQQERAAPTDSPAETCLRLPAVPVVCLLACCACCCALPCRSLPAVSWSHLSG